MIPDHEVFTFHPWKKAWGRADDHDNRIPSIHVREVNPKRLVSVIPCHDPTTSKSVLDAPDHIFVKCKKTFFVRWKAIYCVPYVQNECSFHEMRFKASTVCLCVQNGKPQMVSCQSPLCGPKQKADRLLIKEPRTQSSFRGVANNAPLKQNSSVMAEAHCYDCMLSCSWFVQPPPTDRAVAHSIKNWDSSETNTATERPQAGWIFLNVKFGVATHQSLIIIGNIPNKIAKQEFSVVANRSWPQWYTGHNKGSSGPHSGFRMSMKERWLSGQRQLRQL